VPRYGTKSLGPSTRENYRADLQRYAIPKLGRRRMSEIKVRDLANFVAWLCDDRAIAKHHDELLIAAGEKPVRGQSRSLSDSTVRNIFKPIRACLGTASQEGSFASTPPAMWPCPTESRSLTTTI
jgi:hypothetical protein